MKLLFIHKDLPGQFEHLLRSFGLEPGHEIVGICQEFKPQQQQLPGVRVETYEKPSSSYDAALYRVPPINIESVSNGLAVARKLAELRQKGFVPDIAFSHLGWGESIYFKDVCPDTPLIGYCEFYHHPRGVNADFDPETPLSLDDACYIRTVNSTKLLGLVGMDLGVSPTHWQRSLFPPEFQRKITVIHEGVDTARLVPDAAAVLRLPNGLELTRDRLVVTYATRNLEPYRGFHIFMRAVSELCRRRSDCHFVIAGGDEVSYSQPIRGETYREKLLREVPIDHERVHFVGRLPFDDYLKILQVSSVHVYLTVPFVLSWSLVEAMAVGCVIVASDTAPVREVLTHGHNGLLADFFSPKQLADMVDHVLDHPTRERQLGMQARFDALQSYDIRQSVGRYRDLIGQLVS
jgi:glycosyltransferase involved in cell wall biosynthesis